MSGFNPYARHGGGGEYTGQVRGAGVRRRQTC